MGKSSGGKPCRAAPADEERKSLREVGRRPPALAVAGAGHRPLDGPLNGSAAPEPARHMAVVLKWRFRGCGLTGRGSGPGLSMARAWPHWIYNPLLRGTGRKRASCGRLVSGRERRRNAQRWTRRRSLPVAWAKPGRRPPRRGMSGPNGSAFPGPTAATPAAGAGSTLHRHLFAGFRS